MARLQLVFLMVTCCVLVQCFFHGDHYDGALGHGLVYENRPHLAHKSHHHLLPESEHVLALNGFEHGNHPIPEPESHHTMIHPSEHPIAEPQVYHQTPIELHHNGPHKPDLDPGMYPGFISQSHHMAPHPEPSSYHLPNPRFEPSHLTVHGYENFHSTIIPAPAHYQPHPEPNLMHEPKHFLPGHFNQAEHFGSFYQHHKPGDGFGPGGHFDLMPHPEIKYLPVPEPFPVYKPLPVEKPYPVLVEKPFPVPIERPIPKPYISKVIQPVIHKEAIIKSHVTHLTHEYPHPSHSSGYHKSK